tara:strand:+ start:850 stop:2148 length:1299 start_codon:yes stop_codon:yes gene_type:complete
VNKLIVISILLIFLSNCSLNKNIKIWKGEEKEPEISKNITKAFINESNNISEFNKDLKLDLSQIKTNNKINNNHNNFGSQNYKGKLNQIQKYKFSKIKKQKHFDYKPTFLKDGIIFFEKKGSIIRYDQNRKIIWKKNHYLKSEKKLNPKLEFILDNQNLLIIDTIAKYYSININTGELNWMKNNTYPFNSNIKKYKDRFFAVDYKNTLRCYKIKDGSECWNLQTEDSFTVPDIKYSLIIVNNNVIFNNSLGDITAVNIETGLITWQLPTQSSSIINETYNFKNSKLVSDSNSIFFSNNKNQFYSIDLRTGTINWTNKINSIIKPVLIENLILTVSNEGFLYVVDKNKGNILRVTDLLKNYKDKERKNINPIGFVIGNKNLYLTNSNGQMIVADIELGDIIEVEKVSSGVVSEPFIFNNNLYVVNNRSILQYN